MDGIRRNVGETAVRHLDDGMVRPRFGARERRSPVRLGPRSLSGPVGGFARGATVSQVFRPAVAGSARSRHGTVDRTGPYSLLLLMIVAVTVTLKVSEDPDGQNAPTGTYLSKALVFQTRVTVIVFPRWFTSPPR